MKNTKNATAILIALFAIFVIVYACQPKEHKKSENQVSNAYKNFLLTKAEADTLQANYEKNNYKKINADRKSPDAREVLHEIDVIEGYLQYVKAEADKRGVKNVGIKFVFGQYPDKNPIPNQNPEYNGYQTVFLKPYTIQPAENSQNKAMKLISSKATDPLEGVDNLDFGNLIPPHTGGGN